MRDLKERVADLVRFNRDPSAIAEEAIALIRADTLEEAEARIACLAMLEAWPGARERPYWDLMTHARHVEIILPQEARDE